MTSEWYEVWADEGGTPPYLLLVRDVGAGGVEILDPGEGYRVVHTSESYQEACYWLTEDEFTRVMGRMPDGPVSAEDG